MKRLKPTLITVIAVGLLAGSAVGVAAQAEPVEFTAEWGHWPQCCSVIEPASDPRFEGELGLFYHDNEYPSEGGLRLVSRALHLKNDDGIWRGIPQQHLEFPDGSASGTTQTFIGEGDYAGFYSVVDITTTPGDGGRLELHGYIFEGEPPAAE